MPGPAPLESLAVLTEASLSLSSPPSSCRITLCPGKGDHQACQEGWTLALNGHQFHVPVVCQVGDEILAQVYFIVYSVDPQPLPVVVSPDPQ